MDNLRCNSCHREIINSKGVTIFKCPSCSQYDIVRCSHCRKIVAKYTCPGCKFVGPN